MGFIERIDYYLHESLNYVNIKYNNVVDNNINNSILKVMHNNLEMIKNFMKNYIREDQYSKGKLKNQ